MNNYVALTEAGANKIGHNLQMAEAFLSSTSNNLSIEDYTKDIRRKLEESLNKQLAVEKRLKQSGLSLKDIFAQSSLTGKPIYDENFYNNLKNFDEKAYNTNMEKVKRKQETIFNQVLKAYTKLATLIDKNFSPDIEERKKEIAELLEEFVIVEKNFENYEQQDKLISQAAENIIQNLNDETFLKYLHHISKTRLATPSFIPSFNATENQIEITETKGMDRKIIQLKEKIDKDFEYSGSKLKYIGNSERIKNENIKIVKKAISDLKEELIKYLREINKVEEKTSDSDYIKKLAERELITLYNHLSIEHGELVFEDVTLFDTEKKASNINALLGSMTEVRFQGKDSSNDFQEFIQNSLKNNIATLFTGKDVLERTQYQVNGEIRQTILKNPDVLAGNLPILSPIKERTQKVSSKIDNLETHTGKNNQKFIIAYSDKMASLQGLSHISLINSSHLMSSLDLFLTKNDGLSQKLYQTAIQLSNASIFNDESKREELKKIGSQILSAHFMEIAFNSSQFEEELEAALGSITEGNSLFGKTGDRNVIYVFRATDTYVPASQILLTLLNQLSPKRIEILGDIVEADITYDMSKGGYDGIYTEAKLAYPSASQTDARWAYVASQIARNTKISAYLNLQVLDGFMNLGI